MVNLLLTIYGVCIGQVVSQVILVLKCIEVHNVYNSLKSKDEILLFQ